jgi:NAD(P)-dependent dehydrogenase (short-subunit alcohol dehydrogenase family)
VSGRLAGKVALVTGAASGIGAATVEAMRREGAIVIGTDVDAAWIAAGAAESAAAGDLRWALDVTRERDWSSVFDRAAAGVGVPDVLVNNAGVIPEIVAIARTTLDEWRRVMAVNLDGTFLGVAEAMRRMTGRGGAIVNVSSVAGLVGMPFNGAYGPSKAGVLMLTKGAALEGARLDPPIRVNAVHPGYIGTPMTESISGTLGAGRFERRVGEVVPMRRLGAARDVADAIVYLASDEARFVTGSSLVVDGGYTAQ